MNAKWQQVQGVVNSWPTGPYVPYTVEVSARTVMGEGPAIAHVVFTEHGGECVLIS